MGAKILKRCSKCGIEKPESEFSKNKGNKDGLRSECKSCQSKSRKAYTLKPKIVPPTKTCSKCGVEKDASKFPKSGCTKDGLGAWCKPCLNQDSAKRRQYHKTNPPPIPETKVCPKCGLEKPSSEFSRSSSRPDGLDSYCKPCMAGKLRVWKQANPDKVNANNRRRRERKVGAPGVEPTHDELSQLRRRQRNVCPYCGKKLKGKVHVDHIIPLIRGGSKSLSNLVFTCNTCNCSKGGRIPVLEWRPPMPNQFFYGHVLLAALREVFGETNI